MSVEGSTPSEPTIFTIESNIMSTETKKTAEEIKKTFEIVKEGSGDLIKKSDKFDKDLSEKIRKVQHGAQEVIKHIEKKSG